MSFGGGGHKEVMSEINVTPLCDIFVVLLIIFMLCLETKNQQGPAVDMPNRINPDDHPPDEKEQDECNITIKDLAYVYVNGKQTDLAGLPAELQNILPKTKGQKVMVRTDGEIPLERAVRVIGIAQANGAKAVGLGTQIRPLNP